MLWVTSVCRAVQSWSPLGSWKHHVINNNYNQFPAVLLKSFFFLLHVSIYICMNINPAKRRGRKKKKKGRERGNKNSVHQADFSWFTIGNYHSLRMAGLLLWESRAGGALLVRYPSSRQLPPPANSPCTCLREASSKPDRRMGEKDRWRYLNRGSWESWVCPHLGRLETFLSIHFLT